MARDICCTSADRSGSPDAPGARIPVIPPLSERLVSQYQPENPAPWDSLTPSDRIELEQRVPKTLMQNIDGQVDTSSRKSNLSPSGVASALKRRWSRGSFLLQNSPTKLRNRVSKRFSLDQIKLRASKYWPDAKPADVINGVNSSTQFDSDAELLGDADILGCVCSNPVSVSRNDELELDCSTEIDCPTLSKDEHKDGFNRHLVTIAESATLGGIWTLSIRSESAIPAKTNTVERASHSSTTPSRTSNSVSCPLIDPRDLLENLTTAQATRLPKFAFEHSSESQKTRQRHSSINEVLAADTFFASAAETHSREDLANPFIFDRSSPSESNSVESEDKVIPLPNPGLGARGLPFKSENARTGVERAASNSSVHLYNMRISQHLRSLSGFSGQSDRNVSPRRSISRDDDGNCRLLLRRKSGSGFSSTQVPSSWGRVVKRSASSERTNVVNQDDQSGHCRVVDTGMKTNEVLSLKSDQNRNLNPFFMLPGRGLTDIGLRHDPRYQEPYHLNSANILYLRNSLDGPADQVQGSDFDSSRIQPAHSESVRENYNETTAVWEKALRVHQEDQLNPQRSRTSSFGTRSRKSSRSPRKSTSGSEDQVPAPGDIDQEVNEHPRLEIKRVNTSHSFDLMTMPGRQSIAQQASLTGPEQGNEDRRGSRDQRLRSTSQPPPGSGHGPSLLVPKLSFGGKLSLAFDRPGAQVDRTPSTKNRGPRRISNLKIWSKFPSHTREERNGPAGVLDHIIVRDFQPSEEEPDVPGSKTDKDIDSRHASNSKWRTRLKVLSGKYLTDLSTLLQNRAGAGFRRREHGHRSSISAGGALEYPELELLPRSEPQLPAVEMEDDGSLIRKPLSSSQELKLEFSKQYAEPAPRLGSSNYDSSVDEQLPSPKSGQPTSAEWAEIYGRYVQSKTQTSAESVSLLDGANSKQVSELESAMAIDSLSQTQPNALSAGGNKLKYTTFDRAMRKSTQDLHRTLDESELIDVARALRAADEAFK